MREGDRWGEPVGERKREREREGGGNERERKRRGEYENGERKSPGKTDVPKLYTYNECEHSVL